MVRENAVASPNRTLANKQGGLPMDIQLMLKPQKSTENRGVSVAALLFVIQHCRRASAPVAPYGAAGVCSLDDRDGCRFRRVLSTVKQQSKSP